MYSPSYITHNWLIYRLINEKIHALLPRFSGVVLDLGCGERPFEQDILRYADTYIGVDWPNTLHGFKADIGADLNKPLPLGNGIADHVISFSVLEHLAEPGMMLREAFRVLRAGGSITLSVPFQWWLHEAPWDYQRYTCYGLEYQLRKVGFENILIEPTTGFWSMWVLKLNYQLARLIIGPRPVRAIIRVCLVPVWWFGQTIALLMDRVWKEDRETATYIAVACKP